VVEICIVIARPLGRDKKIHCPLARIAGKPVLSPGEVDRGCKIPLDGQAQDGVAGLPIAVPAERGERVEAGCSIGRHGMAHHRFGQAVHRRGTAINRKGADGGRATGRAEHWQA